MEIENLSEAEGETEFVLIHPIFIECLRILAYLVLGERINYTQKAITYWVLITAMQEK